MPISARAENNALVSENKQLGNVALMYGNGA
jgi:hypothetical protein